MCADTLCDRLVSLCRRRQRTVTGHIPATNGALQSNSKNGALHRQRERADRTGKRERRREVQEGHVVEVCARAVARVRQHVARLHSAIETKRNKLRPALCVCVYVCMCVCVCVVCVCNKSGPETGPAYGARLHCRWRLRLIDLPGVGNHAEVRQKHRPGGARTW